jgi:hypothetical protein
MAGWYDSSMNIIQCDICNKTIEKGVNRVYISLGSSMLSDYTEMCVECGKPIIALIDKLNKKDGE